MGVLPVLAVQLRTSAPVALLPLKVGFDGGWKLLLPFSGPDPATSCTVIGLPSLLGMVNVPNVVPVDDPVKVTLTKHLPLEPEPNAAADNDVQAELLTVKPVLAVIEPIVAVSYALFTIATFAVFDPPGANVTTSG